MYKAYLLIFNSMKQKKQFIFLLLGLSLCFSHSVYGESGTNDEKTKTISFRGIYADDPSGREGLYNPERGLRLEIAVDIANKKDVWNPKQFPNITGIRYLRFRQHQPGSKLFLSHWLCRKKLIGRSLQHDGYLFQ